MEFVLLILTTKNPKNYQSIKSKGLFLETLQSSVISDLYGENHLLI